jgi:uncharacterized cupredoxin-like copper-binding protein
MWQFQRLVSRFSSEWLGPFLLGGLGILISMILISMGLWSSWAGVAIAAGVNAPEDLARQPQIEVKVSLGNTANELKFVPAQMAFESGKRYKLVLTNPSNTKHYFTAKDFADSIWSQKVDAGNVEIKGAIHDLELRPGAQAAWVFVPIKSGTYELHCSIPGHTEAGMTGKLTVSQSSSA